MHVFLTLQYGIELYNDYRSAFVTQFKLEETEPTDVGQRMAKVQFHEWTGCLWMCAIHTYIQADQYWLWQTPELRNNGSRHSGIRTCAVCTGCGRLCGAVTVHASSYLNFNTMAYCGVQRRFWVTCDLYRALRTYVEVSQQGSVRNEYGQSA